VRRISLLSIVVYFLTIAPAQAIPADEANDICGPADDPCLVTTAYEIANGSVLDFGSRTLQLPGGSGKKLDVGDGTMTILAGHVTVNGGSGILGKGGVISIVTTGNIKILRAGSSKGRVDVSSVILPGLITLTAGGNVTIDGTVTAQGTGIESGLGGIDVAAGGSIMFSGELLAGGGGLDTGGDILLDAMGGTVTGNGTVICDGGDGGDVIVSGDLGVVLGAAAKIDVKGTNDGGSSGDVDIISSMGDVEVTAPITATGATGIDIAGDGGDVTVSAQGSVTLLGAMDLSGAVPDGDAGSVDVSAGVDVLQQGAIVGRGRRMFGTGGSVDFLAERDMILGPIDVVGECDECTGGDVTALAFCSLTVPANVTIGALGPQGTIALETGRDMRVAGTLLAGGRVDLRHRLAGTPPNTAGSTIVPAAIISVKPIIPGCGCDPGPCGNGVINCGERCDDGNTTGCDGCAATCLRVDDVCGDGVPECLEECDPGNATDCNPADTCSATCEIEACGNGRVECSEECDEGGASETCQANCQVPPPPGCGDGVTEGAEECDDGNDLSCDGCTRLCVLENVMCGDGLVECAEECDDLNVDTCDGCSDACLVEECGNGIQDCGEECDDGENNGQPGSTCLPGVCRIGNICTEQSTEACVPCADDFDCDPLGQCSGLQCLDGVCTLTGIDCDDGNVCTIDGCDGIDGCTHELRMGADVPECDDGDGCTMPSCDLVSGCVQSEVEGFSSVTCRTAAMRDLLDDESVDPKVRPKLLKLVDKVDKKIGIAAEGENSGKTKKIKKGLKGARNVLRKPLRKKVSKFTTKGKIGIAVGGGLIELIDEAEARTEVLLASFGF
jgi:cysteine-rich repeat protein